MKPMPERLVPESGTTLLVVMVLSATFSLLSMFLISTTELGVRSMGNGVVLERAERAAHSGVEWAAAEIELNGESLQTVVVSWGEGLSATVTITPNASPNVLSKGSYRGIEIAVEADIRGQAVPTPYAFASFDGTNDLAHRLKVDGDTYLGDPVTPVDPGSALPCLDIDGDLDMVSNTILPDGMVVGSGQVNYGVTSIGAPVWDTSRFVDMPSRAVNVYHFTGSTVLRNKIIDGIVVVNMVGWQQLTIWDSVINGTIVVPVDYDPNPPAAISDPVIRFRGNVLIQGGTAITGNLAILSPHAKVAAHVGATAQVEGVSYVRSILGLDGIKFVGQLLSRGSWSPIDGDCDVDVPTDFEPDAPIGILWPSQPGTLTIDWMGRP